jgi:hypothetical protein
MTSAGERPESRPFILVPDSFWKFVVKNRRRKKRKKKKKYSWRWRTVTTQDGGEVLDDIRHPVRTLHGMRETIWHDIRKCRFHGNRPRYDRQTCRLRTFSNVLTKAQICSAIRRKTSWQFFQSKQSYPDRHTTRITRTRETSHKNKREKKKGTGGKMKMGKWTDLLWPCGEAMLGRWGKWLERPRVAFRFVSEGWAGRNPVRPTFHVWPTKGPVPALRPEPQSSGAPGKRKKEKSIIYALTTSWNEKKS